MKPKNKENQKELSRVILAIIFFLFLIGLAFAIIRPFIAAILGGILLAYILNPIYQIIKKVLKNRTISAAFVCIITALLIVLLLYFIAQITIKEAFRLYMDFQNADITNFINTLISKVFPDYPELTNKVVVSIQQGVTDLTSSFINTVGKILTNSAEIFLSIFLSFFVAFHVLKEKEETEKYIREVMPFNKEVNERFIKRAKEVASATVYGHFLVAVIQGLCAGIGFYIFGAPSPLFFMILAMFFASIPYLGAWIIWIPVSVIIIASGNTLNGVLLFLFGFIFISTIDDIVRPYIIGKKAKINLLVVLIGILGGLVLFGPIGLIVGPIILELLLIFLELYKTREIQKFI